MKDKVFIDTNIWVYASLINKIDLHKRNISINLIQSGNFIFVSTQVLNEFYSALLKYKINDVEILGFINEIIENTNVGQHDIETLRKGWSIKTNYQFTLWDSLIIASAQENNCSILYTEDMHHKQLIEGSLTIINPFK